MVRAPVVGVCVPSLRGNVVLFRKSAVAQLAILWIAQQGWLGAQQAPAQGAQQPPAAQTTTQPPAAKPPVKEVPADPSDEGFSIGVFYWYAPTTPHMRNGAAASKTASPATLDYPGNNRPAPGAIVSIPAGKYNSFRISYFETRNSYSGTAPSKTAVRLFGSDFNEHDVMQVQYKLQHVKASWDYLSWPFPYDRNKLRIKTLWQVHYTTIHTYVEGPITIDSIGNVYQSASDGSNSFFSPALGLGLEKAFSRSFRWEGQASAFALPHRFALYDIDTFFAYKHKKLEIDIGAKAFYFKTSPKRNEFVRANMPGAYVGIRWYL